MTRCSGSINKREISGLSIFKEGKTCLLERFDKMLPVIMEFIGQQQMVLHDT